MTPNIYTNYFKAFKLKRLAMINKDRSFFQYNIGDLVYIISPLTSQLCTTSRKLTINNVCPVVKCKIIEPHNYIYFLLYLRTERKIYMYEAFIS